MATTTSETTTASDTTTTPDPTAASDPTSNTVAGRLGEMFTALFGGEPPVPIEFWDGSVIGGGGQGRVVIRRLDALRRLVWSPDELGIARAFVAGDIDLVGPVAPLLRALQEALPTDARIAASALPKVLAGVYSVGAVGRPLPPPPEEYLPRGVRHSLRRDKSTISHHYDVGNDFYRLVLGSAMTYSCARFVDSASSLEDAQAAKHDLICRKLGLDDPAAATGAERPRLLDVGCGWGSMAIHAASTYGADVVGVTISKEQAALARRRVESAGLTERVEIRLQDYREVPDGPFDAISSIGMAEHVGKKNMVGYFRQLHSLVRPGGRVMNHAIASKGGSKMSGRHFMHRYVFPDGELLDLGDTVLDMERAGFEVRDVENLREHYATTLRHWVSNLERNWDDAVALVGEGRCRVWQLYMSASINGFDDAGIQLYQTLGVRPHDGGRSDVPLTRSAWV
jgi:cyclopropane-fatty-acyl-phospholipid synthase